MSWQTIGKSLVALGTCGLAASLYTMYWQPQPDLALRTTEGALQSCRVLKIFDGDTLGCDLNGNHRIERPDELVRLIGIDAPEMHYSKKNKTGLDQPYAVEAMRLIETTALRQTVYLESDHRQRDRYGRVLAYIYLTPTDPVTLNERLLSAGYAVLLFIPPNEKYRNRFEEKLAQAQQHHQGLWRTVLPKSNESAPAGEPRAGWSVDSTSKGTDPSR